MRKLLGINRNLSLQREDSKKSESPTKKMNTFDQKQISIIKQKSTEEIKNDNDFSKKAKKVIVREIPLDE
jgi:hypothetical protein